MIDRARESRNPKKVIRVTLMESYGEIGRVPVNLYQIKYVLWSRILLFKKYKLSCLFLKKTGCGHEIPRPGGLPMKRRVPPGLVFYLSARRSARAIPWYIRAARIQRITMDMSTRSSLNTWLP